MPAAQAIQAQAPHAPCVTATRVMTASTTGMSDRTQHDGPSGPGARHLIQPQSPQPVATSADSPRGAQPTPIEDRSVPVTDVTTSSSQRHPSGDMSAALASVKSRHDVFSTKSGPACARKTTSWYLRWDSNPQHLDFESSASANWATEAGHHLTSGEHTLPGFSPPQTTPELPYRWKANPGVVRETDEIRDGSPAFPQPCARGWSSLTLVSPAAYPRQ